jgi:hypothetical protein
MDAKPGDRSEPDTDTSVEDVLAAFNADEIVEDPTNTESEHANEPPAATPDSPNPI